MSTAFKMPEPATSNDRVDVFRLANGGLFPIMKVHSDPQNSIREKVESVSKRFLEFDAEVRKMKDNRALTDLGRAQALQPMLRETLATIETAISFLDRAEKTVDGAETLLVSAEEPKPTDAVSALREWEIRQRFGNVDAGYRTALLESFTRGENGEVLNAVLRDPLPSPERTAALTIHRAQLERENADLFKAWDEQREAIKLARIVFGNMAGAARVLVNLGVSPADSMTRLQSTQPPSTA